MARSAPSPPSWPPPGCVDYHPPVWTHHPPQAGEWTHALHTLRSIERDLHHQQETTATLQADLAHKDRTLHEAMARISTLEAALASSHAALAEERGKRARAASGHKAGAAADAAAARAAATHKTEVRRLQEGAREQQRALEAARGKLARAAEREQRLEEMVQVSC